MAYVVPQTDIELMENVPLTPGYTDTFFWNNLEEQIDYFKSMVNPKFRFINCTYQRQNRGYIRLELHYDDVCKCNYLRYRNYAWSEKWFYAFILSCEYINDDTVEVQFQIDDIQTWWFEFNIPPSLVLRQHTDCDYVGYNIAPEPVNFGEYLYATTTDEDRYRMIDNFSEKMCLVYGTAEKNIWFGTNFGDIVEGSYTGLNYRIYSFYSAEGLKPNNKILMEITNELGLTDILKDAEKIPIMYMLPLRFLSDTDQQTVINAPAFISLNELESRHNITETLMQLEPKPLDGYTPKNNKLYTYPYNYYSVNNGIDGELVMRYEFFNDLQPKISIDTNLIYPIGCNVRPSNYKNNNNRYHIESITLANYPLCSFKTDSFLSWLSQSTVPTAIQSAGNFLLSGINPVFAAIGSVNTMEATLSSAYRSSIVANNIKGNYNNGNTQYASKLNNIYGGRMCISHQDAKRIDNFFTRYGYAIGEIVDEPKKMTRTRYMYIKLSDAHIEGNIPSDVSRNLEKIFNNGITLWQDKVNTLNIGSDAPDNIPTRYRHFYPPTHNE